MENNDCNKGKQAYTRSGIKSAKAAAREPQSEIREGTKEEEMGKGSAEPFIFLLPVFNSSFSNSYHTHTHTHT